jgi:hypothetical protein
MSTTPPPASAGVYDAPFTPTAGATDAHVVGSLNLYQHLPPVEWPASASPEALAALARECGAVHAPFEVAPGEWVIEGPVRGVARLRGLRGSAELALCWQRAPPSSGRDNVLHGSASPPSTTWKLAHWIHAELAVGLCSEYRLQRLCMLPPGLTYACPLSEDDVVRVERDVGVAGGLDGLPPATRAEVLNTMGYVVTPGKPFPRANKAQLQRVYAAWPPPPPSQWLRGLPTAADLLARKTPVELLRHASYYPLPAVEVFQGALPPGMTVTIRDQQYARFSQIYVVAAAATEAEATQVLDDAGYSFAPHYTQMFKMPGEGERFHLALACASRLDTARGAHAGREADVPLLEVGLSGGVEAATTVSLAHPPLYLPGWVTDPRYRRYVSPTASVAEALNATALRETMHFLARRVLVVLPASVRAGVPASQLPPRVSKYEHLATRGCACAFCHARIESLHSVTLRALCHPHPSPPPPPPQAVVEDPLSVSVVGVVGDCDDVELATNVVRVGALAHVWMPLPPPLRTCRPRLRRRRYVSGSLADHTSHASPCAYAGTGGLPPQGAAPAARRARALAEEPQPRALPGRLLGGVARAPAGPRPRLVAQHAEHAVSRSQWRIQPHTGSPIARLYRGGWSAGAARGYRSSSHEILSGQSHLAAAAAARFASFFSPLHQAASCGCRWQHRTTLGATRPAGTPSCR